MPMPKAVINKWVFLQDDVRKIEYMVNWLQECGEVSKLSFHSSAADGNTCTLLWRGTYMTWELFNKKIRGLQHNG